MKKKLVKKEENRNNKLKLGIAFGGGGTRGFAHLGVIKAFEEEGITFDEVAGTSVGSLVGALYAYGLSSSEMFEIAKNIKVKEIRNKFLFSNTKGIQNIINNSIGEVHIEELKIPFTAVAVDIKSGNEIHFTKGSVSKAVAASCAVPIVFKPVEYKGYRLFDGGLSNTVPADVLRNNGCDVVISIDVNHTRGLGTESLNVFDLFSGVLGILMKSNAIKGKVFSNVCIEPELKKFKSTKIDGCVEMMEIGYNEAKKQMPAIKEFLKKRGFWSQVFSHNKTKILNDEKIEVIKE